MGNSQPSNSKLHVYIQTEKQFYNSGSIIQGVVFVQAKDNFQFDALFIRVQGDQYCQWFEGSSKNRRKFTGNQNFYTQQHILFKFSNGVQQGRYTFPFSMEISENIPGSFQSTVYDAHIRYKLVAYFANYDIANKRHRYQMPIIIRQPFRLDMAQYEGKATTTPKSFFFFSKGEISIEANFMKNVCFEGEAIKLKVNCDNSHGRADVKRITINLVQYTFISANNGAFRTYKKVINSQYIKKKIPKGSKATDLEHNFQISEKLKLSQTAISTLVANYYRLEVFADIGAFSKDQPCIYCPIFIMKKKVQKLKKSSMGKHNKIRGFQKQAKSSSFPGTIILVQKKQESRLNEFQALRQYTINLNLTIYVISLFALFYCQNNTQYIASYTIYNKFIINKISLYFSFCFSQLIIYQSILTQRLRKNKNIRISLEYLLLNLESNLYKNLKPLLILLFQLIYHKFPYILLIFSLQNIEFVEFQFQLL